MRYKLLFILMLVLVGGSVKGNAQYENVWAFGRYAGLDFNGSAPVSVRTAMRSGEACASVCDAHGNLLFYTEGSYVWNRNNDTMLNGKNLTGLYANGRSSTESTVQGAVIVPIPGNAHKYYIFSLSAWTSGPAPGTQGRLYYSIVDMDLDNGLGAVVAGSKGIFMDSTFTEEMTAVLGSRCDVWLLVHSSSGNIKAYEITESGINLSPVVSPFPAPSLAGQSLHISPDHKKIVAVDASIRLGEFDPATGEVTNVITLPNYLSLSYSAEFSPDNTKLYVYDFRSDSICQFDISSWDPASILASKTAVAVSGSGNIVNLKLAPDGKIYFPGTGNGSITSLSRINFPNISGSACQYEPDAVTLLNGTYMNLGLPNVVPVVIRDTFLTTQDISAGCFANINLLTIRAVDSSGWDYLWNTGLSGPAFTTVRTPGTYWLSYHTPPCNYNVDTFHVSFPDGVLPDVHIQNACKGSDNGKAWATTYSDDTVTYHYWWQNSGGDTLSLDDTLRNVPSGNYILRVSTAHCDTTLSFFLPAEEHHVSFQADSIVCQGTALNFINTSDTSFTQFQWNFGDQDSSLLPSPDHTYQHPGRYEVQLIGTGKICNDTTSKTIVVDSMFIGRFFTRPDSICTGESITFYPETDSSTLSLHWQFGDGMEMTSGNEENVQHAYEASGMLPVTLNMQFRVCPDTSFSDTVYVYALPKVDLGQDTSLCLHGAPIILQNRQVLPAGTYHYRWNTGDTTAGLKVVHPGIYSLSVRNEPLGCRNTAVIKITKNCYVDMPNAFTPNGDSRNDYFFPRQLLSRKITQFKMQVFNRWGELIFETTSKDGRGWDGEFNGKPQPEGVYIYVVDALINDAQKEHYQGNVTLIR